MDMPDPFQKFASTYDLFPRDEAEIRRFFEALTRQYTLQSVLDCACGTGRDLLVLHELGLEVVGSDISPAMLAVAERKLKAKDPCIPLVQADFRDLPAVFSKRFDAVLCLSTSLPSLANENDIKKALLSMRTVLTPGGILVLTQGMTDKMLRNKPRYVPILNSRDHSRIMVIGYLERTWEVHVLDCFHSEQQSSFEAHSFIYLTLLEDDYVRLLKEAGFRNVRTYGTFGLDTYSKTRSEQLIVIATNT